MLQALQVHTLKMLQHLKIPPLWAGERAGRESSIVAYFLEATEQPSWLALSVEDLLGAHSINDAIWGRTNPCNVSVDTANSKGVIMSSHIAKQHTFKFRGSAQPELLNMTSYKPRKDDLSQNYYLDFLDNFKDWNILLKVNDATKNGENTIENNVVNQKHQDYCN